jgi:hypothetical protein
MSCFAPGFAFLPRETALGGAAGRTTSLSAPVVALPRRQVVAVTGNALDPCSTRRLQPRGGASPVLLPVRTRLRGECAARRCRRGPFSWTADPRGVARRRRAGRGADRRRRGTGRGGGADIAGGGHPGRARRRRRRLRQQRRFRGRRAVLEHGPRPRRRARHGGRGAGRRPGDLGPGPQRGRGGTVRDAQRLQCGGRRRRGLGCPPRRGTAGPGRRGVARLSSRLPAAGSPASTGCGQTPRRPSSSSPIPIAALGALVGKRTRPRGASRSGISPRARRPAPAGSRRGRRGATTPGVSSSAGPVGRASTRPTAAVRPAAPERGGRCGPSSGPARLRIRGLPRFP